MSLTLYLRLLRMSRISVMAWGVILGLWGLLVVSIYPSISHGMGDGMEGYIEAMPQGMKAAFGLGGPEDLHLIFDGGSFTLPGYLNVEYLAWLPLVLGIYSVVYCGGLISKEYERGTLDTLLSQPLSRNTFLLTKFLVFATQMSIILIASLLTIGGATYLTGEAVDNSNLLLVHVVALFATLSIAGYSTLASCIFLDSGRSLALAGFITAFGYFLNILGGSIQEVSALKFFSIFYYYDSLEIIGKGTIDGAGILLYSSILAGSIGSSLVLFSRKDLTS